MEKYKFGESEVFSSFPITKSFFDKWIKNRCGKVESDDKKFCVIREDDNTYLISSSKCFNSYISKLTENAIFDSLTGAYNKKEILEALKKQLENYIRYKKEPFSVMIFDIDFFKKVNDTYGHLAGDFILKEFVKIIKKLIRKSDILGRFGGEEFVLILPNTKISGAMKLAERIKNAIENHTFNFNSTPIKVTTSIGITSASLTDSVDSLLARADEALYEAKRKGRNRIE
ncbi:GGDEF domain-containing protein, partial [Caminibacter pacificus]